MNTQQEILIQEAIARHRARRRRTLRVWEVADKAIYALLLAGAIVMFLAVLTLIVPIL